MQSLGLVKSETCSLLASSVEENLAGAASGLLSLLLLVATFSALMTWSDAVATAYSAAVTLDTSNAVALLCSVGDGVCGYVKTFWVFPVTAASAGAVFVCCGGAAGLLEHAPIMMILLLYFV